MNYLLFKCTYARLIWVLSPLPAPPAGEHSESLYQNIFWVLNMAQQGKEEGHKSGPWILWRIWKSRNDYAFKGVDHEGNAVITKALMDIEEWNKRSEFEIKQTIQPQRTRAEEKWEPPPQGWLKCNSDGAWEKESQTCGIGWVLRNHIGEFGWMGVRKMPRLRSPIEVEAEAMRWAMMQLIRLNFTCVIFETDSKELVNAVNQPGQHPMIPSHAHDIAAVLAKRRDYQVVYKCREGNRVADRAAKEASSFDTNVSILHSTMPVWIKSLVEED